MTRDVHIRTVWTRGRWYAIILTRARPRDRRDILKTPGGAMSFAERFGRTNRVDTWTKIRLDRAVTR